MKQIADISMFESLGNASSSGICSGLQVFNSVRSTTLRINDLYEDFLAEQAALEEGLQYGGDYDQSAELEALLDDYAARFEDILLEDLNSGASSMDEIRVAIRRCANQLRTMGSTVGYYLDGALDRIVDRSEIDDDSILLY